ncbi:MAG: DoxX family protein [Candidatus Kaiserbacteria bacterium]|nr:DoxX family protein [Candidatus Kaiserbacteria bacterium]
MLRTNGVLAGRFLLALLFVSSGVNMLLGGVGNTAMYFDSMGIPMATVAAVVIIALKIGAGLCLMLGVKVEEAALALFIFTGLTILIAHRDTADMNLWKNLSIMGGMLYVMAYGAGDGWKLKSGGSQSTEY